MLKMKRKEELETAEGKNLKRKDPDCKRKKEMLKDC